jgi:tetratricopeptide (TPR) repeat protein
MVVMKATAFSAAGRSFLLAAVFLVSPLLTACAAPGGAHSSPQPAEAMPQAANNPQTAPQQSDAPSAGSEPRPPPSAELSPDVLYDILLAEIAGQRGRLDVATPHYLQAALESDDPQVAERAVQIATFAKQYDAALRAASHWLELDPSSIDARKIVTALALKVGNIDEVVRQLDFIIGHSGNPEEGFQLATAILARHADKQEGLEAMERLAARYPDNPAAVLAVCRLAILAEQLERALVAVDRALEMDPGLTEAYILKAQVLLRQDREAEALQMLRTAIDRNPEAVDLHLAYGQLLLNDDDTEGAREQFRTVVRLAPDNNDALYSLALLELETGDLDAAERHLKQLLQRGEKLQAVRYYLGYTAEEGGDDEKAIDWYRQVEEGEYWTQARLRMSRIMVRQGRLDEMKRDMQVLRRNNPENTVDFYLIEGQVLSDLDLDEEAYQLYGEALQENPDDEHLLYARALVAEKTDRLERAEADLRHILGNDPDNVRALNALGYTLADRTERYTEALGYIEQAYAQNPDDPAIVDSMGWVQYRLGNLDKAREYLQQAYDMSGDPEIGAHLGEVLWVVGERDAARQVWQESLENAPDNAVLKKVTNRFLP